MNLPLLAQKIKEEWNHFFETVEKPCFCLFCHGSRIHWNGKRSRTASLMIDEEVVYLPDIDCRRVKCANPNCLKSWTLRPPGLMPRRHYQLCVVANAASGYLFDDQESLDTVAQSHQCTRRTAGRWITWLAHIARPSDLIHYLLEVSKETVLVPVRKIAISLKKGLSSSRKQILERAAEVLGLLEAIALILGMEPPGLRSVVEAVVNNRDRVTTYACPAIPELAR